MKKFIAISFTLLAILPISIYLLLPGIILNMITDYKSYTFEKVLNNHD